MLSEAGDPVEEPEGREQAEAKDMVVLKVEEEDDFVRKRQEVSVEDRCGWEIKSLNVKSKVF